MRILSLTLSLLVTACLAADNSNNKSSKSNPTVKVNSWQHDKAVKKKLQLYVDFDPEEYFSKKHVSVEEASRLSYDELIYLESNSEALALKAQADNAPGEENVHRANWYLAKLLKMGKPLKVQQAIYDAWKDSGFSDIGFMDVAKETLHHYPLKEYCELFAKYASEWHLKTGTFLQMSGEHSQAAKYHIAQHISINFIYNGLARLMATDCAELERCVQQGSFDGILALAKRIATSYSKNNLQTIRMTSSGDSDAAEGNKIALMAIGFSKVMRLAWEEEGYSNVQSKLIDCGINFDVKSALRSKDPNEVVTAFEECIDKAADNATKNLCVRAVQTNWNFASTSNELNTLENLFNNRKGSVDEKEAFYMLKNVVEPAMILINCKRIIQDLDNDDLTMKLKEHGIESNENALKQKASAKIDVAVLCDRLLLIQKSRDYLQHRDDAAAYIREDLDKMSNSFKEYENARAYETVGKVFQELQKDSYEQKCTFDLDSGKLICKSPEMLETLMQIQQSEVACSILVDFCETVVSGEPLPSAVTKFTKQVNTQLDAYSAGYSGLADLRPERILFY